MRRNLAFLRTYIKLQHLILNTLWNLQNGAGEIRLYHKLTISSPDGGVLRGLNLLFILQRYKKNTTFATI